MTGSRSDGFIAHVERTLPDVLERFEVPAVAVAVIEGADVVWTRGFGACRADSVFEVASLTKTMVSLAVLSLVERGKVELDRAVNDYLERWRLSSTKFDTDDVTVRRLLSHTAGLPVGFPTERSAELPKLEALLDGETDFARAEIVHEPGSKFLYANPGYAVLELLIEEVTGTGFADAMRSLVFEPLGMRDTGFQDDDSLIARNVEGFQRTGKPVDRILRYPRAAGGVLSTASDIGRLLVAVSSPAGDGGLLRAESLEEMRRLDDASRGAFGLKDGGYSLGLAQGRLPSGRVFVANNGSHENYNALMLAIPDQRTGFVVLTNSATGIGVELDVVMSYFDLVAGEAPNIATIAARVTRSLRVATMAALVASWAALLRVAVRVLRGERRWAGRPRWKPLVTKTVPLGALAGALVTVFDTRAVSGPVGGIPPARFVSDDYADMVAALALALAAIGAAATVLPKRRPD
jgi:CubicO group peptidase (beta-lactamase class C family)